MAKSSRTYAQEEMRSTEKRLAAALALAKKSAARLSRGFKKGGSTDWSYIGSLAQMAADIERAHGVSP